MFTPKKIIECLFGVKLSRATNWIINGIILIFLILSFLLIPKYSDKKSKHSNVKWRSSQFSGLVDSTSQDFENHAVTTVYFKSGINKTNLPQHYYSIFKVSGTDSISVKRNNKIIKFL